MNNRFRTILFIVLAVGQFVFARHYYSLRFTIDLLFLIIFFIAIRSGFMTSILGAALIGFCSDYLTGGVMGVFSFSRTLAAYFSQQSFALPRPEEEYFHFPAHPGLPVPVEPGGLCLLGPDLQVQDHGQPAGFSAIVHGPGRHDHPGPEKSEVPAGCILAKGS